MKFLMKLGNVVPYLKLDLKMKLSIYLFLISLFQIHANSYSQNAKISLELNNVTIENVLKSIEEKSEFKFLYNDKEIDYKKLVSVKFKKTKINRILNKLFFNTTIDFEVLDKQIILVSYNKKAPYDDLFSQQTINGSVVDESGIAIAGANVIVKGTSKGSVTDFDGNFNIQASPEDVLEVSYIGYVTQSVTIGNQTSIKITLIEDASQLEEVVIIGYGTARKSDLTGAVASVGSKDIDKYTYTSAANALQGRMAGVRIQSSGGAPNGSPNVIIRGSGTLSDAGPLYVIDGMITGNMNTLNPADIESISVLKDASASAIYGSRAANGVVIVTTKKGIKGGGLSIDFETSIGVNKVINTLPWANARQYADIVNMANDNDGVARFPANDSQFNPNNTSDLYGESLRSATVLNTSLRLSGGSEDLSYSFSMNNFDNEGIVRYSDFERTTIRSNVNFSKGKFKLDNTIGLTKTVNNPNPFFGKERNLIPTIRLRDDDGNWSASDDRGGLTYSQFYGVSLANTIHELAQAALEDRTITRNTVIGNIAASYEIVNGLTYKINGGLEYYSDNNYMFTPTYDLVDGYTNNASGLRETNTNFTSTLVEHTLNYKNTFGKHTVDLLGGFSEQINKSRSLGIVATGFADENVRVASAASSLDEAPSTDNTSALQSYFGRFNYNFDDRYLLTATLRRDGSSLFKKDLQWGTFPSFAVGWNISNEKFMENVTSITDIKLRGSYGEIGSNNVAVYSIDPSLNLFSSYVLGSGAQQRVDGYAITNGVNANIIWETTKTTDIGLEFNLLDKRLGVTLDYFIKESEDVLVSLDPAFYTGFGNTIPENSASIKNKGFEFTANYSDQIGELRFNVAANFSTINNEVTSLGLRGTPVNAGSFTSNTINSTKTDIGRPISSFFGYIVEGVYQTDAEATAANDTGGNQVAGDLKFKDIAGPDGSGPDGIIDENDRTYIGNPTPDFEYGINLALDYKNFDLNLFFNGVSGNEILNGSKYRGIFDTDGNYLTDALNAWTPSNTNTSIPRMTQLDQGNNRRMSTFYLENGSFFRLANAQLGYSIPSQILDKIKVNKIRVFVSATNLFTITDYTGYYPEVGNNSRTGSVRLFNSGVDEATYPTPRTFQAGLQVSF